jgi:exodeoxyribonuclease V alpha subunit
MIAIMDDNTQNLTISGTVSALVYRNPDNGYSVLKLDSEGKSVTAVGCLPEVYPGEALKLVGVWTAHAKFGEQFKAESFEREAPTGAEQIYRYLSSGVIRGIGPGKAREIVEKFGAETLSILEASPEMLSDIRGITAKSAREIGVSFRRTAGVRRLMELLGEYNIRPLIAMRLYNALGDAALDEVTENPYIITEREFGADFSEADKMALEMDFEPDCPERVEAAVLFEMRHNLGNGHAFLPCDKLAQATMQLIGADEEALEAAIFALCEGGHIVRETIAGRDACYLAHMYEAEAFVAQKLLALARHEDAVTADVDKLIDSAEREQGITYAAVQRDAVRLAASRRVMALTGGPGTGKTTSVRGILALFDAMELKTALCAPTGRAAKRMGQLAEREAVTIHRLLGAAPSDDEFGELRFERDETNPLRVDAVIVDETSMLDLPLARALLAAIPDTARVVFVGDADQLPSVGPGNVFSDIIKSGALPTVRLTEIFRQASLSGIVSAAHMVNRGVVPDLAEKRADFFFLKRPSLDKLAETLAELCAERLPKNMNIPAAQIQVLSPTRRGVAGTESLNARLQAALNPPSDKLREKTYGGFTFREGDRVMQIRNDYDIVWRTADGSAAGTGVYNGDLGVITRIDLSGETLTVDYEDKLVEYMFEQLSDLEPAFAMTVHKSQGSEYRAVVLAIPSGSPMLATRAVLYTAITRARELLIMVGDPQVFETMVKNDKRQRRYSGLKARLSINN